MAIVLDIEFNLELRENTQDLHLRRSRKLLAPHTPKVAEMVVGRKTLESTWSILRYKYVTVRVGGRESEVKTSLMAYPK